MKHTARATTLAAIVISLALLHACTTQRMGHGSGMGGPMMAGGPGGMGHGMGGADMASTTPGWSMMSPEEREAHRSRMHSAMSPEECDGYLAGHHKRMMDRAKERNLPPPTPPRQESCRAMRH